MFCSALLLLFTTASSYDVTSEFELKKAMLSNRKLPKEDRTQRPSVVSSSFPSIIPSIVPSLLSSSFPSSFPTESSESPSQIPTRAPIIVPSMIPSGFPSPQPIGEPTSTPSYLPSKSPSASPTVMSSIKPSIRPSSHPTIFLSDKPSLIPSIPPTSSPSQKPSNNPSASPIVSPSLVPSVSPTSRPTELPTIDPNKLIFLSASLDTVIQFVPNKMSSIQKEMYKDDVQAFLAALFLKTVPPIENVEVLVGNQVLEDQVNRRQRKRALQFVQNPLYTLQVQILVSGHYVNSAEFQNINVDLAAYLNSFFTTHGHVLRDFIKGRHVDYFDNVQRIFPVETISTQPIVKQGSFFTTNGFQITLICVCGVLLLAIFFLVYSWLKRSSKSPTRDESESSFMRAARDFGDTVDYLDGKKQRTRESNSATSSESKPLTDEENMGSPARTLHKEPNFNNDVVGTPKARNKKHSKNMDYDDNDSPHSFEESRRRKPPSNASRLISKGKSYDEADYNNENRESYHKKKERGRSNHHRQRRNFATRTKLPEIDEVEYNHDSGTQYSTEHTDSHPAYTNGGTHVTTNNYDRHSHYDYNNADASSVHSAPTYATHEQYAAHIAANMQPVPNQNDYRNNQQSDASSVHSIPRTRSNGYRSPVNLPPNDNRSAHYNADASSIHSVPNMRARDYRSPSPNDYPASQPSTVSPVSPVSSESGARYQNNHLYNQSDASSVHSMPTTRARTRTPTQTFNYNDTHSVHSASNIHGDGYRSPTNTDETSVNSHSRTQRHDHRSSHNTETQTYALPRTISPQYDNNRKANDDRRYHDDISSVTSFRSDINSIADSIDTERLSNWQKRDCFAPPGKLGLAVRSSTLGPVVTSLHDLSPLQGQMFPGDFIVAIDDLDTRGMPAEILTKVSESRKMNERRFTVMSKRAISQT